MLIWIKYYIYIVSFAVIIFSNSWLSYANENRMQIHIIYEMYFEQVL